MLISLKCTTLLAMEDFGSSQIFRFGAISRLREGIAYHCENLGHPIWSKMYSDYSWQLVESDPMLISLKCTTLLAMDEFGSSQMPHFGAICRLREGIAYTTVKIGGTLYDQKCTQISPGN